jgi:hypothetical protein
MNKHTPKLQLAAYDSDFYLWSMNQAALIRAGKFDQLDIENVAEEIESLGRSDKRALRSQLRPLLTHLLKWNFQASRRSNSWRNTINSARDELVIIVRDSPSLQPAFTDILEDEYAAARKRASRETSLDPKKFPGECPYCQSDILNDDFFPEA